MGLRVIAIDGPAGSGKSTVARGWPSGSASSTSTPARCTERWRSPRCAGLDPADADAVAAWCRTLEIDVDGGVVTVDGVDASIEIRGPEVTRAVSIVAANPAVRAELRDASGSGPTSAAAA